MTALTLNRLGRRECTEMVTRLAGNKALPDQVVDHIATKTDGVPLFVEEMTKSILELDLLDEDEDRFHLKGPLPALGIPISLQDSLMARLDPIPLAKELAQMASVIGRSFGHDLLADVSQFSENELGKRLRQLLEAGLVYRRGNPPDVVYEFKHALVQDTAYQSLLKSVRIQVHDKVARALEKNFQAIVESDPQLLAHHFTEAGKLEKAFLYWRQAGESAVKRSANVEAVAHLEKSLSILAALPETPERVLEETTVQIALGVAQMAIKGFASDEVGKAYLRARELSQRTQNASHLFAANWGLWISNQIRIRYQQAQNISEELLQLAGQQEDSGFTLQAHHAAWTTRFSRGDLAATLEHTEEGNRLYSSKEHRNHAYLYGGHDPGVCSRCFRSWTLWLKGLPDQAKDNSDEARAIAEQLDHPFSLAQATGFGSVTYLMRRDAEATLERANATTAICEEHGFQKSLWASMAATMRGWGIAQQGQKEQGIALVQDNLNAQISGGSLMFMPFYVTVLAQVQNDAGLHEESQKTLSRAFKFGEESGERWWEPEVLRLMGIQYPDGDPRKREYIERAQAVAAELGSLSLELRAATSLARLMQMEKQETEARNVLTPVYDRFTEGFDTPDLMDAKQLIDELT